MHISSKLIILTLAAIWTSLPLAGCASIRINAGTGTAPAGFAGGTTTTTRLQVSTGTAVGTAIIVGILVADGVRYFRMERDGTRTPVFTAVDSAVARTPGLAPRVNVQDCAQPIDLTAGNLVCR